MMRGEIFIGDGRLSMKCLICVVFFLLPLPGSAGGLAIQIEGELLQETREYVAIRTSNTTYRVKRPEKGSSAIFKLKKINQQSVVLNADSSFIVSKMLNKNPKGVK